MKKVAILYGGLSTEREVSLKTGKAVFDALQSKPFDSVLIDVDRSIVEKLKEINPDVAVIALHGKYGEDGCIQGLLEIMGIPYTGPGVMASSIGMNKIITKKLIIYDGIPTPEFTVVDGKTGVPEALAEEILSRLQPPMVIKAASQGSSIGIYFAFTENDVVNGVVECLKYDHEILAEQYIKGRELTVSVIGNEKPTALPTLEIISNSGVYDYHAKYTVGASSHFAVSLPPEIDTRIKELAIKTYKAIGCRGLSRIDFLLSEDNLLYVLEVNTSPGMTETSLFPDAGKAAGISFPDLIEMLVKLALKDS